MNETRPDMLPPDRLTSDVIGDVNGIRHGFLTRAGGVSSGLYDSLNCGYGSGDTPENVHENRIRAKSTLSLENPHLLTCHQIHSARVVSADVPWTPDATPEADGMVTTKSDVVLGILTADCAPVLFADGENRVVAAAHAGWRGALRGVTDQTINKMLRAGAKRGNIVAAIGPTISQDSYEVGEQFRDRFAASDPATEQFFKPGIEVGKFQFDLTAYVAARLEQAAITQISVSGRDTYSEETRFFSYRRSVHKGETDYGRALSMIALAPYR